MCTRLVWGTAVVVFGWLCTKIVLVLGFSNLLGDGVAMAFGEYISADAEQKYACKVRDRKARMLQNDPVGDVDNLIGHYISKGFDEVDAETVAKTMFKCGDLCSHFTNAYYRCGRSQ